MVRPISIDHTDFRNSRISLFGDKVFLAESDIIRIHGKPHVFDKLFKTGAVKTDKAVQGGYRGGQRIIHLQRFGLFHRCFAAFDGVDDILLDAGEILFGNRTLNDVNVRGVNVGTLALGEDLDTLSSGVCTLVKLTGQIFNRKNGCTGNFGKFIIGDVQLRFGEDDLLCISKEIGIDVFDIVTVEHAKSGQTFHAEQGFEVGEECACFTRQRGLFFYKYAIS